MIKLRTLIQEGFDINKIDVKAGIYPSDPSGHGVSVKDLPNMGSWSLKTRDGESKVVVVTATFKGRLVGKSMFGYWGEGSGLKSDSVYVIPYFRKKGLANKMYDEAEKLVSGKIIPTAYQTPAGKGLWKKRMGTVTESAGKIEVPEEPGTVAIPPNHLRLYHYTSSDPEVIRKEGLKLSNAKGHSYGEPNVVWASLQKPGEFKVFVEFSMAIDDSRFTRLGAKPDVELGVEYYRGRQNDFTILGDVNPSEFIAVHEPWHHTYRYLVENNMIEKILVGEFDDLTAHNHPNEYKAILVLKHNFGK